MEPPGSTMRRLQLCALISCVCQHTRPAPPQDQQGLGPVLAFCSHAHVGHTLMAPGATFTSQSVMTVRMQQESVMQLDTQGKHS